MSFLQDFREGWETNEAALRRAYDTADETTIGQIDRSRFTRYVLCRQLVLALAGQSSCGLSGRPELAELIEAAKIVRKTPGVGE